MKKKISVSKIICILMCLVFVSATFTGCRTAQKSDYASTESQISENAQTVSFTLTVVDADGKEETFDITTTEETVGAALLKEGLIEGENGEYGLYVKSVNNIRADFEKDGTYWAFYVDGKYALAGVDSTQIKDGGSYMFKVEK